MTTDGISFMVTDVTGRRRRAFIGDVATVSALIEKRTYANKDPQAAQVDTLTIGGFLAGRVYDGIIELPGGVQITYTYTAVADDTDAAGVAAKVLAAIAADPILNGLFTGAAVSNVITITARSPRVSWTAISGTYVTAASVTVAALADPIPVGCGVILYGLKPDVGDVPLCRLPATTKFDAQVDTWTITYDAGVALRIGVEFEGKVYEAEHVMASDLATSLTAAAAQINARLPASTVDVSGASGTTLVFTSEKTAIPFKSWISFGTGRDTGDAVLSRANGTYTLEALFGGVAVRAYDDRPDAIEPSTNVYNPNEGVKAIRKGPVWVKAVAGWTPNFYPEVFIGLSGSEKGYFFTTNSATRAKVPNAKIIGGNTVAMLLELT